MISILVEAATSIEVAMVLSFRAGATDLSDDIVRGGLSGKEIKERDQR